MKLPSIYFILKLLYLLHCRFYGMRKQNPANLCQSGCDTNNAVQGPPKVADANPTPIITVTTPSTGSGIFPSPKKVNCIKMMFP